MSKAVSTQSRTLDTTVADRLRTVSGAAMTAFSNAQTGSVDIAAALDMAGHVQDLRDLFDMPEVKAKIVALQDTPLGFRTDSDPKTWDKKNNKYKEAYAWPTVRDCTIEATLRGLQMVGNQFNIISHRCYVTKEGFEGLIRKLKGLEKFSPTIGVPNNRTGGVLVECSATWVLNGKPDECKATIPVKTDDYSTGDQTIGKATRKFLKRCYEQMTGVSVPEGEDESGEQQAPAPAPARRPKFLDKPAAGEAAAPKPRNPEDDQVPGAEVPTAPVKNHIPTDATPDNRGTANAANREPAESQGGRGNPAPAAGPGPSNQQLVEPYASLQRILDDEGVPFDTLVRSCLGVSAWAPFVDGVTTLTEIKKVDAETLVRKAKYLRAYIADIKAADAPKP